MAKGIENRIWKYRKIKGLNQKELAFLLNQREPTQVSRYERGLVIPEFEKIWKISRILEAKFEDLFPELISQWNLDLNERYKMLEKIKENKIAIS